MIKTFTYGQWKLVLDSSEIDRENPGNGTPALVHDPRGNTGTFFCVIDTGELEDRAVPSSVLRWLESKAEAVDLFIAEGA